MQVNNCSRHLVHIDHVWDVLPGVSTVKNLVDLFIKCVIMPCMKDETIQKNHYFMHLKQKKLSTMFFLLIPVIGNIVFVVLSYRKETNKKHALDIIQVAPSYGNEEFLKTVLEDKKIMGDRDVAQALIKKIPMKGSNLEGIDVLPYLSEDLRNNIDVVLERVKIDPCEIQNAGDIPKSSKKVALEVVRQVGSLLSVFNPIIQDDEDVVLTAIREEPYSLEFASPRLKDKEEVVREAVRLRRNAIHYASRRIKNLPEFHEMAEVDVIERSGNLRHPRVVAYINQHGP